MSLDDIIGHVHYDPLEYHTADDVFKALSPHLRSKLQRLFHKAEHHKFKERRPYYLEKYAELVEEKKKYLGEPLYSMYRNMYLCLKSIS